MMWRGCYIQMKKLQRRGHTDRWYHYNVFMVAAITIMTFIMMWLSPWLSFDLSPLAYIVPAAWAELAIHSAFIVRKAERENIHKYPQGSCTEEEQHEFINNEAP